MDDHSNLTPFFGIKKQENQEEQLKKEADTQNILNKEMFLDTSDDSNQLKKVNLKKQQIDVIMTN